MVEGFIDTGDKEIISDVKRGDFSSINRFYKIVQPQFVKWCFKNYRLKSSEVEDLFQDAFELLYKKIVMDKLDHLESSVKTYFFAICKYKIYEKFRATKVEPISNVDDNVFKIEKEDSLLIAEDEEEQNLKAVLECKKKLSLPHQAILNLYYEEKKSMKEIALALKYKNEDVVKSQKARCILQLKKCVKNKLKLNQE